MLLLSSFASCLLVFKDTTIARLAIRAGRIEARGTII
jgi:hypothetical protein